MPSHSPPQSPPHSPPHSPTPTRTPPNGSPRLIPAPGPAPRLIAFEPRALRRSVVVVLAAITVWLVGLWIFHAVSRFLFLLLVSWLIAMAMEPAVSRLARRGLPRSWATAIVGGSILILIALLAALFGSLFFRQASQLVQDLPGVVTDLIAWINRTFKLHLDATSIASGLKLSPSQVGTMASTVAGGVLGLVSSLLSAVLDTFTCIFFAFYLAAEGPKVRRTIGSWLSPARQEMFVTIWDIAVDKTGGYVVSKLQLAALSAFCHGLLFYLIGVPSWLPLALLVGIVGQFVPVLGTYIGIIVPVLFVAFTDPLTAVWIVAFATVYQQVENYVFTPRISRRTMDVNSGIALAAVIVGAALWGAVGALIGIPLAAAAVAILDTYGHRYELVPALAPQQLADAQAEADPEAETDADPEAEADADAGADTWAHAEADADENAAPGQVTAEAEPER